MAKCDKDVGVLRGVAVSPSASAVAVAGPGQAVFVKTVLFKMYYECFKNNEV